MVIVAYYHRAEIHYIQRELMWAYLMLHGYLGHYLGSNVIQHKSFA